MNLIEKHLDKDNLHHAYLIEGAWEEIVPEIKEFCKSLGINTTGSADFIHINLDSFKMEDAHNLKSYGAQKGYSSTKKIFIVSANSFLLEAQNSLLKMFEEPIENTHFFLIAPDANALLKTLVSRFYLITTKSDQEEEMKNAEKFIALPLRDRIDFIKELLIEPEEEDKERNVPTRVGIPTGVGKDLSLDSAKSKALKFLNALESVLHQKIFSPSKMLKNSAVFTLPGVPGGSYADQNFLTSCFQQILKVREFLRMPGSSAKSLMESIALIIPEKI